MDGFRLRLTEFADAELHARTDRLADLLTEDFRSIGERGFLLDKQQWIARHADFHYRSVETTDENVRHYHHTAIVRCVQHSEATWQGQELTLSTRVSQVWVQQSGVWRLAALQFSALPPA